MPRGGEFTWASGPPLQLAGLGLAQVTSPEHDALQLRQLDQSFEHHPYPGEIAIGLALALLMVWRVRRAVRGHAQESRARDRWLQELFDASPDAMWVKDGVGVYRDCNDRAGELFHTGCGTLIGGTDDSLFDKAFAARMRAMDGEVMRHGRQQTCRLSLEVNDGTVRQLEVVKVPLHSPDGGVSGVLSMARDMAARLEAEARLQLWAHAFQHAAFGVEIYDVRTQRISAVNPTFARERGYSPEEMVGMPVDALYPADLAEDQHAARRAAEQQDHSLLECEHVARGGRRFSVLLDRSVIHDTDGNPQYAIVYALDISERKRTESELRLAAVAFQTQEALMVTGPGGKIQRVNEAFSRLTGYRPEDVLGKTPSLLGSRRHDQAFYVRMWEQIRDEGFWQGEQWIQVRDGLPRAVRTAISSVSDGCGKVSNYVCTMTDLTSELDANARVDRMTFFDQLTDLPNRRFLHGQIQHMLDEGNRGGALLMVDLDHFKRINDRRGHAAGDRLLRLVAARLRPLVDEGNVLARFAGGTFAIFLDDPSGEADDGLRRAMACAERVRQALERPFQLDDHTSVVVTGSIGVTELVPGQGSPESMFKEAELAMYGAKEAGRNRVHPFAPAMQADLERRETIAEDLRQAIETDALELHLQPQVDREGCLVGAEALLRWPRPDGETISPAVFVPIAEERGLILALGEWVLQRACAQLAVWAGEESTRDLVLAVNVSARQFSDPGFVDSVTAALSAAGADASRLELELTETAVLDDLAWAATKLASLRALGIRVSLDDFGTGYSSLAYLSRLPLDQLKIDRSFVSRLPEVASDAMVAQTIIGMGHGLGLEVIAEGVETEDQRVFLTEHGCDAFQGFLFARALPPAEFEAQLRKRASPE